MQHKKGFTILELALAMAFLSFLLLAIGMVTIQVAQIYQKGIAIKNVNSVSRELTEEFNQTISASRYQPPAETETTGFKYNVYFEQTKNIELGGVSKEVPINGAFCTGRYSYIWNTGYALNSDNKVTGGDSGEDYYNANVRAVYQYTDENGNETNYENPNGEPLRLLKLRDTSKAVCTSHDPSSNIYTGGSNPIEILSASDGNLALYDLTIFTPVYHANSGHTFFTGSFILGTVRGGVDITLSGDYCQDRLANFTTDFTYCSVNKFNFAARAAGDFSL